MPHTAPECTCAAIRKHFDTEWSPTSEEPHHGDCPSAVVMPKAVSQIRFAPYSDWVVVKLDTLPQMTDGKHGAQLHRPWRIADWTAYARVIAIGPGARDPKTGVRIPIDDLMINDHVVLEWRPSHEKEAIERICGDRTVLLRAHEIVGVVEDETPTMERMLDQMKCEDRACEASGAQDGGGPA